MSETTNYTQTEDLLRWRNKQVGELREQISEMQLLLDKANEQLQKGNIPNVMSSRLEEEIEKVRSSEQLMYSQTEVQELLRAIKDNRQSHFQK